MKKSRKDSEMDRRQKLVTDNVKLAHYIAWSYRKNVEVIRERLSWDETKATALYGLVLASRSFDFSRGIKFSTYAFRAIIDQIRKEYFRATLIRVPVYLFDGGKQERNASCVKAMLKVSFHWEEYKDLKVMAVQKPTHNPDEWNRLLSFLPRDKWREVIRLRYFEDLNYTQCSERIGVTKQRVKQIETAALNKLRTILTEKGGC